MPGVIDKAMNNAKDFVSRAFGFIGTTVKTTTRNASTDTKTSTDTMQTLFGGLGTGVKTIFGNMATNVGNSFSTISSDSKTKYGETETNVSTINSGISMNFKETWETLHGFVKDTFVALGWTIKGQLKQIGTDMDTKLKEIAENVPKPFEGAGQKIADQFSKVPDLVKNSINGKLETVMKTIAENCPKKFTNTAKEIAAKFNNTANLVKTAMGTTKFANAGTAMVNKVNGAFSGVASKIAGNFTNTATAVQNSLSPNSFYNVGVHIMQSLNSGFRNTGVRLPHLSPSWSRVTYGPPGQESWFNFPETFNVSWYAKGGFPNFGELFVANENGPEMIGRMGNKNVVANNMQIAEGIRSAVVDGMMEVFMATGGNQGSGSQAPIIEFTWKTDSETLYRQTIKGREKMVGRGFKVDASF